MAGISIPIATDTRQAAKEVNDLAKGFDKVADSLDDVAKESARSGGKLEDSMKDAQRETKETADAFQQLGQAQRRVNQDSTADFELSTREKRKLSRETIHEIGDEAKQNAAETFSSFDGSAQSFVDGIQGTFGGLVSSLGPMGLALGAAGALAIGLVNGALQKGDENSQQFKADVADLTQAFIDAGSRGVVGLDRLVSILQKLATGGDDAGVTLDKLYDLSKRTGGSFEDLAQAYAGNSDKLRQMVKDGEEHVANLERQAAATDQNNDKQRAAYSGLIDAANAQKELNNYLSQAADKADAAKKAQDEYVQAGGPEMAAKAKAVENLAQAYEDAAGDVEDYTDKETGAFDPQAYIDGFNKKAQALADYATNLQKAAVTLTPAALQFLESQGTDAASVLVKGYLDGTAAQQAQMNAIWSKAGSASSANYMAGFKGGIPTSIPGPDVVARWKVDRSALDAAIRSQIGVTVPVKVVYKDASGRVW